MGDLLICRYVFYFFVYSFLGWIYETCYCTIKNHRWENRGFLYGPIVPIYGFGALAATIVFHEIPLAGLQHATNLQIFIVSYIGSVFLEYTTSFVLEKRFHARWWDYSKMPLNIKGRVCVPFSIGFGLAGILVVRVIMPFVVNQGSFFPDIVLEIFALALMALLGMDFALTESALNGFAQEFERMEKEINDQMTLEYEKLEEHVAGMISRSDFFKKNALTRIHSFKREGLALSLREQAIKHIREKLG